MKLSTYKIIENKIDNTIVTELTDLWDNILIDLLDQDLITFEEAEEAYHDKYLNEVLHWLKIENECFTEEL